MEHQSEKQQDNSWFERGELPPVGAECEILVDDEWMPVFIIGVSREGLLVVQDVNDCFVGTSCCKFRPLRTEREKAIEEMCHVAGLDGLMFGLVAGKLYDAGYRKEPK